MLESGENPFMAEGLRKTGEADLSLVEYSSRWFVKQENEQATCFVARRR